jgi:hypothetical protein
MNNQTQNVFPLPLQFHDVGCAQLPFRFLAETDTHEFAVYPTRTLHSALHERWMLEVFSKNPARRHDKKGSLKALYTLHTASDHQAFLAANRWAAANAEIA